MNKLIKYRWRLSLGAATSAVAVFLLFLLVVPGVHAKAAEVLAKGAKAVANITSIHIRGQVRSPDAENFAFVDSASPFTSLELWKQVQPELKWRVEKPGRISTMDGRSTVLYIRPINSAMKVPQGSGSAFDNGWLFRMADLSSTIASELKHAQAKGWALNLTEQPGADGRLKSVVTMQAKAALPEDDYLRNKFLDDADTRRVYRFDSQTELLEGVQVYLTTKTGETLIFEVTQIDYNLTLDPALFQLELPANVSWIQERPEPLPDNAKYAAMTAPQAARALFEACGREDWTEASKFFPMPLPEAFRQLLGGLEIVSLGEPFTSKGGSDVFVPYEIKLKTGGNKKLNLALRKDQQTGRWIWDGGI